MERDFELANDTKKLAKHLYSLGVEALERYLVIYKDEVKKEISQKNADLAALVARAERAEAERDALKALLLECNQMNFTADGEEAALWNIHGELQDRIDFVLGLP